jgi:uncharacterized protein YgiM (DUF1202 family)
MDRHRLLIQACVVAACVAASGEARATAYVRVLTQQAVVRTGPGADYRVMHVAERGEVMSVLERGTRGYWFRVELEDGSVGWIFGEQVSSFEVVEDTSEGWFSRTATNIRKAVFAPSPVPYAAIELSFSAGVLGGEGVFLFRPAFLIDPYFAIEGFLGQSPAAQEDLFLGGIGLTLRLLPGAVVGPYLHASMGVAHRSPKADAFTLVPKTQMAMNVGGGFEITLRKKITLRVDFREWVIFDENEAQSAEEFTGGLAIFF